MKKKHPTPTIILFLAGLLLLVQCSLEPSKGTGQASFGFAPSLSRDSSIIPSPSDISAVVITIVDQETGDILLSNHKIQLYKFNSVFVSDSVNLMAGAYTLTQFLVVDDEDNIIYVTPMEESTNATLVTDPLPLNFSVSVGATTTVRSEVVEISENDTPQDYGYSEFSFTIVTGPKEWSTITTIDDNDNGTLYDPKVVNDDSGHSFVIWKENNGSITNLWGRRYTSMAGWETPVILDVINTADVLSSDVVIDQNGNITVIWLQQNGTSTHVWSRRYITGTGWESVEDLASYNLSPINLQLASDGEGNLVAVWRVSNKIYAIRYLIDTGWESAPGILYSNSYYSAYSPALGMNSQGEAAVIWFTTNKYCYSSLLDPATGWSISATLFSYSSAYTMDDLSLTMDDNSDITLTYTGRTSSSNYFLCGRRYTKQAGISSEYLLDNSIPSTSEPKVCSDNQGNALVIWKGETNSINSTYYDLEFGWQTEEPVFSGTVNANPNVIMDCYGNGLALWCGVRPGTTENGVIFSTYTNGNGWTNTELLNENEATGITISLDCNNKGDITAAWIDEDSTGNYSILYNSYK